MSAMKNNSKLIFGAKQKRIGSCTKGFFCFTSYKFKKTEKMFVNSQVSYFTLCYVITRN